MQGRQQELSGRPPVAAQGSNDDICIEDERNPEVMILQAISIIKGKQIHQDVNGNIGNFPSLGCRSFGKSLISRA
jgi:hypothetical protein